MMLTKEELIEEIIKVHNKEMEKFKVKVCEYASELIYDAATSNEIQIVDHSLGDNPYDHSGVLVTVKNEIDVHNYKPDREFHWDEGDVELYLREFHTGQYNATHCSGMGWSYETYHDLLDNYLMDVAVKIKEMTFNYIYHDFKDSMIEVLEVDSNDDEDVVYDYWIEMIYEDITELMDSEIAAVLMECVEEVGLKKLYDISCENIEKKE